MQRMIRVTMQETLIMQLGESNWRGCVCLLGYEGIEKSDKGGMNSVFIHVRSIMEPDEIKFHKAPDDWVDPSPNTAKGDPILNKVNNTGRWSIF